VGLAVLLNRNAERAALDNLLEAVRAGRSGVLVLRGEPGVGKTALLDYATESAAGLRIARLSEVESEMELAFAALHQLCAPMLDELDRLPGPQRTALGVAFGLRDGDAPDRFLVGLAVLSLLSAVAEQQPLLCVIDDAQWLDRASSQVLASVPRRLLAEPVHRGPQWRHSAAWDGPALHGPVPCGTMIRNQPMDGNQSRSAGAGANKEADDLSASHGEADAIGMKPGGLGGSGR
jgi:AAA ATPase domain